MVEQFPVHFWVGGRIFFLTQKKVPQAILRDLGASPSRPISILVALIDSCSSHGQYLFVQP